MNYSLLPSIEKNAFKREYRIRLAIVGCLLMSAAGVVGIAALFPAYIHSSVEEQGQLDSIAEIKKDKDQSGITVIEKALATDYGRIAILREGADDIRLSTVIQSLASIRGAVRYDSVSVSRVSSSTQSIVIQGVAPTRDALVALKSRLELLQPGNVVDLPASQFATSANIRFSIRLTQTIR